MDTSKGDIILKLTDYVCFPLFSEHSNRAVVPLNAAKYNRVFEGIEREIREFCENRNLTLKEGEIT